MKNRYFAIAAVAVAVFAAGACSDDKIVTPPVSKIVTFKATMNGAAEVPANASTGTGTFTATLDTSTNVFIYDVTWTGLSANVNNGHIHAPAVAGVNAGTTINFNTLPGATFSIGQAAGSAKGTAVLTAATAITATVSGDSLKKLLFSGLTYVNIHTTALNGGEIRGQITKQ